MTSHTLHRTCRQRCWRYDWVVDLDIKGFFDNIDDNLMRHALRKHTDNPWVRLYMERWLKAPAETTEGIRLTRFIRLKRIYTRKKVDMVFSYWI